MLNVAVDKQGTENNAGIIRRFTKRVQEAGILRRVRGIRYQERDKSAYVKKKKTLKSLRKKEQIQEMIKLGKSPEILKRR
jgi:ribosomal protein S21